MKDSSMNISESKWSKGMKIWKIAAWILVNQSEAKAWKYER